MAILNDIFIVFLIIMTAFFMASEFVIREAVSEALGIELNSHDVHMLSG